jgi:hypothetical protein
MPTRIIAAAVVASFAVGCGGHDNRSIDSAAGTTESAAGASTAAGNVTPASDTTRGAISATTAALGPGIQVTPTDEHNVNRSFDLKLTDANWTKFLRAADSIAAIRARDPQVRAHLDQQIAGAKTDDAGRKWLEAEPTVTAAITAAGLSVKDYYRLGIVTAAASRYMNDPSAAPPTPAGRENAEFVRAHRADLEHLRAISRGAPALPAR